MQLRHLLLSSLHLQLCFFQLSGLERGILDSLQSKHARLEMEYLERLTFLDPKQWINKAACKSHQYLCICKCSIFTLRQPAVSTLTHLFDSLPR